MPNNKNLRSEVERLELLVKKLQLEAQLEKLEDEAQSRYQMDPGRAERAKAYARDDPQSDDYYD
jgi:ABC-type phosphate transport system auxiliary subunit